MIKKLKDFLNLATLRLCVRIIFMQFFQMDNEDKHTLHNPYTTLHGPEKPAPL
jgi:hypothetical protein